jgi:hypothetical protein
MEEAAELMCNQIQTATGGWSAGKIGTSEFNALVHYLKRKQSQQSQQSQPYPEWIVREMTKNAGFWNSVNVTIDDALDDWASQVIDTISNLDVVVTWNPQNPSQELEVLNHFTPKSHRIPLRALEPYYTPQNQYTKYMTKGKIAVISPFAKSIEVQWEKKENLFPNPIWLPDQALIPIICPYGPFMTTLKRKLTWTNEILNAGHNAALDYLVEQTVASGAKYAFVGIGALSLPLINKLKNKGIVAIHTGGGTQIMFGVKGKRWENHSVISKFFNEYWISPSEDEIPSGATAVEGGCYW